MIRITNEDNIKLMARYEDNHFDLAIVDPPYGIGDWQGKTTKHSIDKKTRINKNYSKVEWNNETPDKEYFYELERVSKNQIIWGANYYNCFSKLGGSVVWDKVQNTSTISNCEIASLSFQKKVDIVRIRLDIGFCRKEPSIHPCEKPVKLYEWLLMNYAKEGNKILDTHLGSGSIAIACHNLGFDLTACELDTDYYNAAMKRLKQHQSQLTMF